MPPSRVCGEIYNAYELPTIAWLSWPLDAYYFRNLLIFLFLQCLPNDRGILQAPRHGSLFDSQELLQQFQTYDAVDLRIYISFLFAIAMISLDAKGCLAKVFCNLSKLDSAHCNAR